MRARDAQIEIVSIGADGLGRGEVNERPVHVRNALPGERVEARIVKKRRGVRFADAIDVAAPHTRRVQPPCEAFPRCGGCVLQHIEREYQLELKETALRDALAEHGVLATSWKSPVSTGSLGYRRKARFGVRVVGDEVLVGFRESFSSRVTRADWCHILTPRLARLIRPLKETIALMSAPNRFPQVEIAQGDAHAALIVRHLDSLTPAEESIWSRFATQQDVQVLLQSGGYETLRNASGGSVENLSYGLVEFGLLMRFHPAQFTQVNLAMNRELVRTALGYLGDVGGKEIADLFCGIGNFSLAMARRGGVVRGYESSDDAVAMAEVNARLNGLQDCTRFEVADLYREDSLPSLDVDAILLDPPRSGAGSMLQAWVQSPRCRTVVYVSCNPVSFAADAAILQTAGFDLATVGVFDMFPHTAHVETIGLFRRG